MSTAVIVVPAKSVVLLTTDWNVLPVTRLFVLPLIEFLIGARDVEFLIQ